MTMFTGSGVAIVTPFTAEGEIDFTALGELIEFQINNGTDAIIIAGTTGEASTMTDEEQADVVRYTVEAVGKRIPVIAGAGSNDTRHGINLSLMCQEAGADALLSVTPYYNKTTQKGMKEHFLAIADAVDIPVILYNVPARTNLDLVPQTVFELSAHENIVGIKDATGNVAATVEIRRLCGPDFAIYSGNDDIIVPMMAAGAQGVISVLANTNPRETHEMVAACLAGCYDEGLSLQLRYKRYIDALFAEANPIPVKAALNLMGLPAGAYRLPLTTPGDATVVLLKETMTEVGLL
ncbi:MAG: 4-hydroxy-tetrahydrodipicolinate synthase [Eubacteriales bacterium]|nr:4-hydroxy-tetrahydrodipicolinate synthase [Eubacteriales bacterium]